VSFYQNGLLASERNPDVQKDIIHLIGGMDELGNNLRTVDEFNTQDMQKFQADWRLPHSLSMFSVAQGYNKVYIAGGISNEHGEITDTASVYQVSFEKQSSSDHMIELGTHVGSDYKYLMKQLPAMNVPRSEFSLVMVG